MGTQKVIKLSSHNGIFEWTNTLLTDFVRKKQFKKYINLFFKKIWLILGGKVTRHTHKELSM